MDDQDARGATSTSTARHGEGLSGRVNSWRDFQDHVHAAMAMAAAEGAHLSLSDPDFTHWTLGQRSQIEAFQRWILHPHAPRCDVLAAHFDAFAIRHPRWVEWRGRWVHRVRCLAAPADLQASVPRQLILHGVLGVRVIEPLMGVGLWTRDPATLGVWLADSDAILQRSQEAMPATVLGL